MARKIEIDLAKVESLAAQGLTDQQIADALGISRATVTRNKRDNDAFDAAIKRGKAKGIALVSSKLMEQVKGGNITAMIFFLKTRAGWSERDNESALLEIEGKRLANEKARRELEGEQTVPVAKIEIEVVGGRTDAKASDDGAAG